MLRRRTATLHCLQGFLDPYYALGPDPYSYGNTRRRVEGEAGAGEGAAEGQAGRQPYVRGSAGWTRRWVEDGAGRGVLGRTNVRDNRVWPTMMVMQKSVSVAGTNISGGPSTTTSLACSARGSTVSQ